MTALLLLAGCQKTPMVAEPAAMPRPALWTSDFPLEELAQQDVAVDECGLALWTRTQPATRVLFASNKRRLAVVNFQGDDLALTAQHERTDLVRGFSQQQFYAAGTLTIALDLEIETRQDVLSSAVVRSGVLTLTQVADNKSLIVPVVGVIGCS